MSERVVYRGIERAHPQFEAATRGTARPRSADGDVTPDEHSAGLTEGSPFTSWTRRREVAERYAGPGGVVLVWPLGPPPEGAEWSWEWSPDVYFEHEVLIRGTVRGARVIKL
jgi:hypothetical protein